MTACVTINAAWHGFRFLIILFNKKNLEELEEFSPLVNFVTSYSGWMTRDLITV
jgi:hypothetical protein